RVLPRLAVSAGRLAQAFPGRRLTADSTYTAGAEAAVTVMFELSREVTEALGARITAAIMDRVGWEAMYEVLTGDFARSSGGGPWAEPRVDRTLRIAQPRLVVGGDRLLKASPACTLGVRAISAVGDEAARAALKGLPPAVGIALPDRALAVIGFYVGWAAMF